MRSTEDTSLRNPWDFLAVLFGYAISGECTLEAFYERLQPFAVPFMALFERDQLPARSTLSRFLAALTEVPVEALRILFLDDLLTAACSKIELSFISSLICLHCSYLFHFVMNTKVTSSCPSPRTAPLFVNSVGARVLARLCTIFS